MPKGDSFAIVDEKGRADILEKELSLSHQIKTVFIDIDESVRKQRLIDRGSSAERLKDDFQPTTTCLLVNGETDSDEMARDLIESLCLQQSY